MHIVSFAALCTFRDFAINPNKCYSRSYVYVRITMLMALVVVLARMSI